MKKSKKSFLKRNKIMIFIIMIFLFYISFSFISQELKFKELAAEKASYEQEIVLLQGNAKKLEEEIDKSKSPEAIEKLAREKLKMVKPNEIIYMIQEVENKVDE